MESKAPVAKQQQPHPYSWAYPSLIVVVAVIVGWSAFWYFKSRQAAAAVTAWMTHEAQLGRAWSCPDRKISGYPFSVEISCTNPYFQGEFLGKKLTGSVHRLRASAPLLQTSNVIAQIDPPLAAKTSDGSLDVAAEWGQLVAEFHLERGGLDRLSLSGNQAQLRGKIGGAEAGPMVFDNFASYFVLSPSRHDRAYDIMISFSEGSIPALNKALDTQLPIAMEAEGTISQVDLSSATTLQDFLEKWRAANGRLEITNSWLTSSSIMVDAKGSLSLDDQHRLDGKLDASFSGFENVFRHWGIDPAALRGGPAAPGLLGGGTGRIETPVTFSAGAVSIGPVQTSLEIPPLY